MRISLPPPHEFGSCDVCSDVDDALGCECVVCSNKLDAILEPVRCARRSLRSDNAVLPLSVGSELEEVPARGHCKSP